MVGEHHGVVLPVAGVVARVAREGHRTDLGGSTLDRRIDGHGYITEAAAGGLLLPRWRQRGARCAAAQSAVSVSRCGLSMSVAMPPAIGESAASSRVSCSRSCALLDIWLLAGCILRRRSRSCARSRQPIVGHLVNLGLPAGEAVQGRCRRSWHAQFAGRGGGGARVPPLAIRAGLFFIQAGSFSQDGV